MLQPAIIKSIIIGLLLLIIGSLFSALVFMYRKDGRDKRMAKALTVRIVLSIALFVFVMLAFYFGLIPDGRIAR